MCCCCCWCLIHILLPRHQAGRDHSKEMIHAARAPAGCLVSLPHLSLCVRRRQAGAGRPGRRRGRAARAEHPGPAAPGEPRTCRHRHPSPSRRPRPLLSASPPSGCLLLLPLHLLPLLLLLLLHLISSSFCLPLSSCSSRSSRSCSCSCCSSCSSCSCSPHSARAMTDRTMRPVSALLLRETAAGPRGPFRIRKKTVSV